MQIAPPKKEAPKKEDPPKKEEKKPVAQPKQPPKDTSKENTETTATSNSNIRPSSASKKAGKITTNVITQDQKASAKAKNLPLIFFTFN